MPLDFRPDFQPTSPGLLTVARNLVPDKAGNYFTSYAAATCGYDGTIIGTGSVLGARMLATPTASRLVVGTAATLKEADGAGGWTDRSGTTYGLTGSQRWCFSQFGDETIACSLGAPTQTSTTGAFSDLSGAPKALTTIVVAGHLLACNYNDGSANPSGIKWASQGSSTTWTATNSNTAGNATLRESSGAITAAAEIHDVAVVWKSRSMYLGHKVGGAGTDIFRFKLLSPKIGCVGVEAWTSTPVGIIFVAETGIYKFDGSVPVPIDDGVRVAFYETYSQPSTIQVSHDESRGNVFFWILGSSLTCWTYNYLSNKWSLGYAATTNLGNTSLTTFVTHVRDSNAIDANALNISFNTTTRCAHLVIATGQRLANLSSTTIANSLLSVIQTGLVRDQNAVPEQWTELSRVMPLWASERQTAVEPTAATIQVTPFSRWSGGGALTPVTGTFDTTERRFDVIASGAVVQAAMTFTNTYFGMADLAFKTKAVGER